MKRMKRIAQRIAGLAAMFSGIGLVSAARADEYGLDTAAGAANLTKTSPDAPALIGQVLGTVLGFTGTIFFILVVWAGLMWMTAAGNDERIKTAQKILASAVIGLIIVLSAYAITRFIGSNLQ